MESFSKCEISAKKIINDDDKYERFKTWFRQNGGLQKSIHFPTRFQPGNYLGLSAQQQIPPNTVILAVPKQLTISVSTAKHSQLHKIINHYPILSDQDNQDKDYNLLCLFLIMEKMKGKQSFYYPYIDLLDSSETLMNWDDSQIDKITDPYLQLKFIHAIKGTFEPVFEVFKSITINHRDIFPYVLQRKLFDQLYAAVMTRGFGWGLPETMLVPYADFLNHSCSGVNHYVFDRVLQERGQKGDYVHKKYQLDLRLFQGMNNSKLLPKDYQRNMRENYIHEHLQEVKRLGLSYDDNSRMDTDLSNAIYHRLTQSVVEDNFDDSVNLSTDSEDNDSEQQDQDLGLEDSDSEIEKEDQKNSDKGKKQQKSKQSSKSSDKFKGILMEKRYMKYAYQLVNQGLFQNFTQPKPLVNSQFQDNVKFDWWYQSSHNKSNAHRELTHPAQQQNVGEVEEKVEKQQVTKVSQQQSSSTKQNQNQNPQHIFKSQSHHHIIQGKYFIISSSKQLQPGQQIFNCYGRRSNRFLLTWYGFCFPDNKYDSVPFRIWSRQVSRIIGHQTWTKYLTDIQYKKGIPIGNDRFNPMMLSEQFRLKKRRINYKLLAYLRFNYLKSHRLYKQHYKGNKIHVNKIVSLQMEWECFVNYKELLNELRYRFGVNNNLQRQNHQCSQKENNHHHHQPQSVHIMFAGILSSSNSQIILRNVLVVDQMITIIDAVLKYFRSVDFSNADSKKQRITWRIIPKCQLKRLYQNAFNSQLNQPTQQFSSLLNLAKVSASSMVVQLKLMIREYFRLLSLGEITDTLQTEFQ